MRSIKHEYREKHRTLKTSKFSTTTNTHPNPIEEKEKGSGSSPLNITILTHKITEGTFTKVRDRESLGSAILT